MNTIFKFSASWCKPCKELARTIEGKIPEGINIQEIDIDEKMDTAKFYGVRSVPTMILMNQHGDVIRRVSGPISLEKFQEFCTVD